MSVSYISQKIKSKTLETTTEAIIENEKLEILTDNQLGIKEIKFINDGTVINTITNSIELSEYENRIFDAVIQSGIVENLVQLINSLKLQSKVDSADNLSNIQAVLTTLDETRVLKISLFIENDESRNIQVSFNDSQWNIEINQDDKNLVKYARILKDKLSAIPEKVFSISFEQLLLVSELGKPITETPLKDMIESYIEYPNFPSLTPDDDEYREWRYDYDRPSQWPKERKYLHEKKQNELFFKIRNSKCEKSQYGWYVHKYYYPLKDNPAYYDYNLRAKWVEKYSDNPDEYIVGDDEICDHLQFQEKEFVDNFQQIKFDYLNEGKNIFNHQNKTLNGDFDSQKIIFIFSLVFKLSTLQNKQKINCVRHHLFVSLSTLRTERFRSFYKSDYLEKIDISFITEINSKKMSEYFNKILINLDAVSGTQLFSSIAERITDFKDILENYKNLSNSEFYQRIYQQTIKSFQNNPEKIEMILADFYKLTEQPIFASSFTILNTAKTSFLNAIKPKSSTTLETTIQINSVFPETITGIFIANDEPNTDTQLSITVAEGVKRTIESKNISIYQNKLFQELFSEVVDSAQILDLTNTLKFLTKESSNNQYTGILSSNDESHQITYRLIPTHQNQYTLHLQSTQFNWENDYQVNLDRQPFVNFINRLDSELVDFIKSLENSETLLNKAITLTPYPQNDFYSGYLTTQNQNNKIDYQIDIDDQNHQTSFTLTTNNHTWNYQLDTANINQRNLIKHINPSFAVQIELDESLNALLNNDNIQAIIICRHNNAFDDAISIYSEVSDSSPELTVLIPTSNIDPSLNNILGNSQVLRIEKHYLEGSCHYQLSFPNYDANAKQIKLTQQINSSGRIQVQTTEANPVKILDDQGNIQISHHSDQVSSEIKEVEHECFVEDANFTYHASGQLIISNLPAGITIEHYVKPPIQNILNGSEEPFIVLKSGDKITFLADDNLAKLTIRII
ncbi:MAG: hypothetical protein O9326_13880 [Microcystis sp. LE19-338.1B]|jgi:hypothetical protein|nr:hypothetical protein [Microcystis sp. LE19-338.1B]MCZ8357974.1 hypothetical protein [Microcystis sp. LE19-388.1G]